MLVWSCCPDRPHWSRLTENRWAKQSAGYCVNRNSCCNCHWNIWISWKTWYSQSFGYIPRFDVYRYHELQGKDHIAYVCHWQRNIYPASLDDLKRCRCRYISPGRHADACRDYSPSSACPIPPDCITSTASGTASACLHRNKWSGPWRNIRRRLLQRHWRPEKAFSC